MATFAITIAFTVNAKNHDIAEDVYHRIVDLVLVDLVQSEIHPVTDANLVDVEQLEDEDTPVDNAGTWEDRDWDD